MIDIRWQYVKEELQNPKNRELIVQNKWEEFYSLLLRNYDGSVVGATSEFLLNIDINPLLYMTKIPEYFLCDSSIKEFDIPDNIDTIGEYAFRDCSKLEILYIPKSVKKLEYGVSYNCFHLKTLYEGSEEDWEKLINKHPLPNGNGLLDSHVSFNVKRNI